jgi:hypothetical protein
MASRRELNPDPADAVGIASLRTGFGKMQNPKLLRSLVFGTVLLSLWIVSRGMSRGIYGFFASVEGNSLRSNLIWPPIVGWPLYFASNHHLWAPVVLLCLVWAFGVPLLVAAGITKMLYAVFDPDCPRSKRGGYMILIGLFIASLLVYVAIPQSLWAWGYWWLSY